MQDTIYTNATVVVNVCEGADCQGCPECPERRAVMTGPDVWTQASIDFFCPDPESPDYLAALFRRAHYYGNTKGMGAVDLATELGHTGGNRESIPEMATPADTQKRVSTQVAEYGIDDVPMPATFVSPTRPNHCRCSNFGDKVCQRSCDYGIASFLPVDCGDCEGCRNWYRYQIAYRFDRGTSGRELQTIIRIADLDSVATAATIASGIGKRDATPRHKAIGHADGGYWVQIVYADALDAHSVYLIELAAGNHGYNLTLESRPVTGAEVAACIPSNANVDGQQPSRFMGWCKGVNPNQPDYVYSDGVLVDTPRDVPRPTRESHACIDCASSKGEYNKHVANYTSGKRRPTYKEWRDTIAVKNHTNPEHVTLSRDAVIDMSNALRGGAMDAANDAYDRLVISGIYQGPKRLIVDLALQVGIDGQINHDARQCLKMAWLALE
jgi:hypothetical protein